MPPPQSIREMPKFGKNLQFSDGEKFTPKYGFNPSSLERPREPKGYRSTLDQNGLTRQRGGHDYVHGMETGPGGVSEW